MSQGESNTHAQPTQKIALITGAIKGIGFEVAGGIAQAGYTVTSARATPPSAKPPPRN